MKNPNGSDIPGARAILKEILIEANMSDELREEIEEALGKMTRQRPVKQAPVKQRIKITPSVCEDIRRVAASHPTATNAEIAVMVGLPSCGSGRVTEVLQGLRG